MSAFRRLTDALMPPLADPEQRSRFEFGIQAWLIAWPPAVVWTCLYLFQRLWVPAFFNGVMVVMGPLSLWGLKRTRSLTPWFELSLVAALLLYGPGMLGQTPPDETAAFFSVIIPLVAGFLFGWRSALVWAAVTAAVTIAALLLAMAGYTLPAVDPTPRLSKALNVISAMAMVALFAARFHEVRRAAQERAEAASRAKSLFLASISHEIRTPMNGVLGMTEVLLQDERDPARREQLEVISRSGRLMMRLLNDLLDVTRLEAQRLVLDRQPFQLAQLLADVQRLFAAQAAEKGLALQLEPPHDAHPWRLGDALRLRQVLFNLVHNSVKFTERGSVTLAVRAAGDAFTFTVRDTGPGIAPELQAKLFSVFEQGDASTTRRYGGTGLGLALSRQLVDLMGGALQLDSRPGEGARFFFTIALPQAPAPPDAPAAPLPAQERQRVLVVDDNPINLTVATHLVERAGFEADAVSSGDQAVAKAGAHQYVAVLMDCHMPEMDGFEATERIRALPAPWGQVPIIAVTASTSEEDLAACRRSGMDEVLAKPVSLAALTRTLSARVR